MLPCEPDPIIQDLMRLIDARLFNSITYRLAEAEGDCGLIITDRHCGEMAFTVQAYSPAEYVFTLPLSDSIPINCRSLSKMRDHIQCFCTEYHFVFQPAQLEGAVRFAGELLAGWHREPTALTREFTRVLNRLRGVYCPPHYRSLQNSILDYLQEC